eukprot:4388594-Amphidinium_carterae.1
MKLCPQQKVQTQDASTQTDQSEATYIASRVQVARSDTAYVYQHGRGYHSTPECPAVTSARSAAM